MKWIKEPVLQFDKGQEAQAEEDGYTFKIKVINGTCEVKDNEEASAADDSANWGTYLTQAEKAIKIILDYCKDKNAFGPKDSPSYENTDIWAIFTAADVVMFHMTIVPILTDGLQILSLSAGIKRFRIRFIQMAGNRSFKTDSCY